MLSSQSLFGRGVEILLRQDQDVELVGEETNAEQAIERIKELCPDVVLVEQNLTEDEPGSLVMRILSATPSAKIVALNLADNTIRAYHGEQKIPREIGDLLQVIKDDPCRDGSPSLQTRNDRKSED